MTDQKDDLDDWCRLVGGKPVENANESTKKEAALTRELIARHYDALDATPHDREAATGLAALMKTIDEQKLIPEQNPQHDTNAKQSAQVIALPRRLNKFLVPLSVAATLLIGTMVTLQLNRTDLSPANIERGSLSTSNVIQSQNPQQTAEELKALLVKHGITVSVDEVSDMYVLQALLPESAPKELSDVFARLGIAPNSDGLLTVSISKSK